MPRVCAAQDLHRGKALHGPWENTKSVLPLETVWVYGVGWGGVGRGGREAGPW